MANYINSIIGNFEEPPMVSDLRRLHETGIIYLPEKDTWIDSDLLDLYPETHYLGSGSSSIVIEDPSDSEKVISFRYRKNGFNSELDLLEKYHMHNVLNILFPEYFPKIYTASQRTGQMRKERVFPDKELMYKNRNMKREDYLQIYCGIENEIYLKSGIQINLDSHENGNLIYDKEGNIKYIDLIENDSNGFIYDIDKIKEYSKQIGLNDLDIKILFKSLNRINELAVINSFRKYGIINDPQWNKLSDRQKKRVNHVLNSKPK